jgi:hypothetical protein
MRGITILLALALGSSVFAGTKPKYSTDFILSAVMQYMKVQKKPDIPLPKVHFESETPLQQFQDAIKDQWNMVPEYYSNAFAYRTNEIFLIDDDNYYQRLKRTIDDSLAHELTHYVQFHYQNYDLQLDDTAEAVAIDVQTWFRDNYP